ncbi:zinc ABC transporter substrate-binding protein [Eubacteriales bacterium OttesenSCG-928-N14]|nr:zinc ABC transporter substrate-binding protein [Eubacteriales bacterium OttesenSCG-928-N14]
MKRYLLLLLALIIACIPLGCGQSPTQSKTAADGLKIVTTLFPQYDFARQLTDDTAQITLLLPPGTESHSFEPKPMDISNIYEADLFIYTGEYMEPWAAKIIAGAPDTLTVVDASTGITLAGDEHDDDHAHDPSHNHAYDPHIWLDPTMAMQMVENISAALIQADPDKAERYRQNTEQYLADLQQLDEDIMQMVQQAERKVLVFGGHFAYRYFLERYGISWESAYGSGSSHDEPSMKRMDEIIKFIRQNNIPVIFHEEMVDPKIARTISQETGTQMLVFHTIHNLSKDEMQQGLTYIDIMRQNAENVRIGLN